jgi:DNA-binding NtrC family response regulator
MSTRPLVLLVDDETNILHTLKAVLEDEQFLVEVIDSGSKVIDTIGKLIPDIVLLDIFLPNYNGLELLEQIKREYPAQDVIMISGFGTIPIATQALRAGARDFIEKPLNLDDVLAKLDYLKKQPAAKITTNIPGGLIGQSALFKEIINALSLVAPLNIPLIIYGPTGSGKSLMAKYVHDHSPQSKLPFVVVNGSQIDRFDEALLTGPGTLFIKNIHMLQPEAQSSLLGFIKTHSAVRVIASSLPTLFSQVQQGSFSMQLFCALNSTPLEIASINKRRYDIPLLVNTFLEQANSQLRKNVQLTPATIRALRNHAWRNDVAEIKFFIFSLVEKNPAPALINHHTINSLLS